MFPRVCLLLGLLFGLDTPARAQVVWEDYQGTNDILGLSFQNKPGPAYNNIGINRLADLRTIAENAANATRTGTSATIDYDVNQATLCNPSNVLAGSYDLFGTGAACQADAQGRVLYALVKFPEAGLYTFGFAHDDDIDVDLSSDYTNTGYRTAIYDLAIGAASIQTFNDSTFETLSGTYRALSPNACALLRVYWNNSTGSHFLRMRWTRPNATTQIVPATQLLDPGVAASASGCSGALIVAVNILQVSKSATPYSDPFFGATNPKAIPGATMRYCFVLTNPGTLAATSISGADALPATLSNVAGSIRSGASCAAASTVEDDNASGADETDPAGASVTGSSVTLTGTTLAAGASLAFTVNATVN